MLIDLADDEGVRFAEIGEPTRQVLGERLDYGLEAVNPLDAWGTGRDYVGVYRDCLTALMRDPDTGIGMFLFDIALEDHLSCGFVEACIQVSDATDKPLFVATNFGKMPRTALADRLQQADIPVLDGVGNALKAVRNLVAWRGSKVKRVPAPDAPVAEAVVRQWQRRINASTVETFDEATGYRLLSDWDIPTLRHESVDSAQALSEALEGMSMPVVLKTAAPGILHKSDVGGVFIGLMDRGAVEATYSDVASRLGPRALLVEMASKGVELVVGGLVDPQFGPIVMIGAGGTLVEIVRDVSFVMAPASLDEVERALSGLKTAVLLDGVRGASAVDRKGLVETIARFSQLVADLSDVVSSIEINPLLATTNGPFALDVLVTPKS